MQMMMLFFLQNLIMRINHSNWSASSFRLVSAWKKKTNVLWGRRDGGYSALNISQATSEFQLKIFVFPMYLKDDYSMIYYSTRLVAALSVSKHGQFAMIKDEYYSRFECSSADKNTNVTAINLSDWAIERKLSQRFHDISFTNGFRLFFDCLQNTERLHAIKNTDRLV